MKGVNCIGLFCEDIREERNGAITLIGIMPDNANTEVVPISATGEARSGPHVTVLSKICFYVRLNFDLDLDLPEAEIRLVPFGADPITMGKLDREVIQRARTEAKAKGNFMAGLITRGVLGGYPMPKDGWMKIEVVFPKEIILASVIYFKPKSDTSTSSTAH